MPDPQKIFDPRPEAQATAWDALMPPVQKAVHDLLVRIYGAHHSVRDKNTGKYTDGSIQQTGNCFLVYGSRGTGKTTVLLNAQRAVCRKQGEGFFAEFAETEEQKNNNAAKKDTQEKAEKLRKDGIIWLKILNLEPIPSEANLLTVLLTQVRNALHSDSDKRPRDQRSIFEEEANSAQQLLNRLISDTTLMWQNITEPDTRNISARQVKAADIYAGFQKKFNEAMDKLIRELSDACGSDSKISIVLPIDNIDRSTEHLQSIVKLAQLVSHPNLWLVMAGDRVEVETFLERAYWKELIRSSDGAGARGKMDSDGEDEALAMARRQATATAQKLWPANHRVEIDFLTPEQTLAFEYKQNPTAAPNTGRTLNQVRSLDIKVPCAEYEAHLRFSCKCYSAANKTTVSDLLAKISIPTTPSQREGKDNSSINLLNLFYIEKEVTGKIVDGIKSEYLTRAAHHGLSLPARSVLDLWQLLDWLVNDASSTHDFRAEKVARTLLRNVISSSEMPSGQTQELQNGVLRRSKGGGTILYFGKTSLKIQYMKSTNNAFEFPLSPIILSPELSKKYRSQLVMYEIHDITLYLEQKSDQKEIEIPTELPPLVGAWLMVLYDILILAEVDASWVMCSAKTKWLNVSVRHTVLSDLDKKSKIRKVELNWNAPDWGLFWVRNIFKLHWKGFGKKIEQLSKVELHDQTLVPRSLAAGWILCVLKTSFLVISSIESNFQEADKIAFQLKNSEDNLESLLLHMQTLPKSSENNLGENDYQVIIKENENKLAQFEHNIMQLSDIFYRGIRVNKKIPLIVEYEQRPIISAAYEVMLATGRWLETELICFLSYAYVPIISSKKRLETMWSFLPLGQEDASEKKSTLQEYWQENLLFILAEQQEKLAEAEKDKKSENAKDNPIKNEPTLAALLFADLHQHLNPADR
ncbi:AAA family ATPase [Methylovulum psychrotolerans]|uniref:P-loop NTPase fold protein n=1 Tax=Methylovulum psychrotolerans TaxID=1704499 RepID=UPI001BFF48D5|nr:P-loop NTPase fold protein [Methylovulum psychrotolerans]MBT9100232.1 AAA family ATPase [Methylovulum psychrotolerans]